MAQKELDYGAVEGGEIFDTDRAYLDGDPRMAARASWFIQFWGYAFVKIADPTVITLPTDVVLLYIDSGDDTLYTREGSTSTKFFAGNILAGRGITVADNGDGTITIKREEATKTIVVGDSPYTAAGFRTILVDASSGDITVNLPTVASNDGLEYVIKRIDNSTNTVTVDADGTELIDETETKELHPRDAMYIISDATQWWII